MTTPCCLDAKCLWIEVCCAAKDIRDECRTNKNYRAFVITSLALLAIIALVNIGIVYGRILMI